MKTAHELLKAVVCAGLAVLLFQTAAAQTTGTYDQFAHQRIEVERYVVLPSTFEYYTQRYPSLMGDHAWTGKQEDAQNDQNTFRMVYAWGLTGASGIPTNATITNVRLYLQGTLTSNAPPNNPPTIDFHVRNFPPSSLNASAEQKWAAINNAQTLATWSPPRSVGTFNTYIDYPEGSDLANAVQSRLGGTFAIAIKGVDESWAQGAPTIHVVDFKRAPSVDPGFAVRIVVNYTVPANNPVPTISSISPDNAMTGGPPFIVTVNGTNFISSSVVRWNGGNRTTRFISATRLEADIPASDIANPGTASVTVYNPPPGGGTSNPATFTITAASVNVTVHQFLADGSTEVGTLGRWNGSSFGTRVPAPQQYTFQIPSTEILHGDTLIYSNQRHRIWIKGTQEEPNVVNHHAFSVTQGFAATLTSQFAETKNDITIKTDLLDAPGTSGGDVQFKDPWYIDLNDPAYGNAPRNRGQNEAVLYTRSVGTTGFKPDYATQYDGGRTYKGVFLNQSGPPFWNPPYYSVGAPAVNYINGIESYFVKWDGNPADVAYQNANAQQTGVVFKTSGAAAVAKYKGHRLSSSAEATSSPNQRKLTQVGSVVHKIYEGSGEIWYSFSADGGTTWNPEFRVSDGTGGHSAPSIASGNAQGLPEVYVVYRKQAGTTYQIKARLQLSGNWQSSVEVSDPEDPSPLTLNPRPVISRYDDAGMRKVLVLWEGENGVLGRQATSNQNNAWVWGNVYAHIGYPGTSTPSLANSIDGTLPVDVVSALDEIWMDHAAWPVSEDPSLVNNRLPSAAMDAAGRLHVAWIGFDKSRDMDVVVHRSFQYGEGSPHYIIIDDFGMPVNLQASVTAHADASNGGVSVFWNDGDIPGVFDNYSYDGINFAGWTYTPFDGPTNHVNAAAYANPTRLTFLATKGSTAPYAIAAASHDDAEPGMEEEMSITESRASKHSRRAFFRDTVTNAAISLEYGDMMLLNGQDTSGQRVAFLPVAGSLREKFMRTEAFRPEQRMRLKLKARIEADRLPREV